MMFIPSHLNALNKLILGHPQQLPTMIFGPPSGGKSILLSQLLYDFLEDGNVLMYDTEGGWDMMMRLWQSTFDKRFGIQTKVIKTKSVPKVSEKGNIIVLESRHIKNILRDHGFNVELNVSSGSKIDVKVKDITDSLVEKILESCNIKFLGYDSLTNPLKTTFVGGRVNFPGRADAINLWLSTILGISDIYPVSVYGISHRSINPTDAWAKPHMTGGSTIRYNFKVTVYLDPSTAKQLSQAGIKKLYVERFFNVAPWTRMFKIRMTDKGYVDVGDNED